MFLGDTQGHADAAVEGAPKLTVVECGVVLYPAKDLRLRPRANVEPRLRSRRQHARDIVAQAASRDMGDGLYRNRLQKGQHAAYVDAGRFEQRLAERPAAHGHIQGGAARRENPTDERKTVGVEPAGGQAENLVAGRYAAAVDDRVVLDHADAETGQIVITGGVHARHLRRLAADERHASQLAAAGDPLDHLVGHRLVELAGGIVVEKVQRLGALDDDVVGAHGDQIDTHAVVDPGVDGEPQLGADAVGSGYQHRPAVAIQRQLEQSSEAPEAGDDTGTPGSLRQRLDAFHQTIAGFDVDTGVAVGDGFSPPRGHPRNGTDARRAAQTLTWSRALHSVERMRIVFLRGLLVPVLALVVGTPALAAVEVKNLYEAGVVVADKDRKIRTEAFGLALLQVAVKVSGSRGATANPVVVAAVASPDRFVQQFRYRNIAPVAGETSQSQALNLWVQFDAPAVDALIREAGMPVWGRVRPSVLVLVAIESARGRELLSSDDPQGWAEFIQRAAAARAVPLLLPLMDLEDRSRLRASDVWAGFEDNVLRAAQRYQSEGVLLGRIFERSPNYWEARWRLLLEDSRDEWLDQGEGLDAVLLAGVEESADLLASRFGGFAGTTVASGVQVNVTGIRSLRDYARTLQYLDSLDEVSRVDVTNVKSGSVSFRVDARGGRDTVRQVIALGRTLAEDGQGDLNTGLTYRLLP